MERKEAGYRPIHDRIHDFGEVEQTLNSNDRRLQASRCMDCGVPFCHWACPIGNKPPEWNDALYRGDWQLAYELLTETNDFPEFTGRICPALCEKACTNGLHSEPVSTKENEKAIIEYAYEHGIAKARPPKVRTGKKVAVIGSGPSGLAVADQLNQRGHLVTVYERHDKVGGLLRYGIPNMKLEKSVIDRKIKVMEDEGITFVTNADAGVSLKASSLEKDYDAVVLCCGASHPRDISAPGREAKGIYYAVDFLTSTTKALDENAIPQGDFISAKGKDVIVIGGGDTGNDCVGTCMRHGAKSVTQLEMMPAPPVERTPQNSWPEWPRILKTDYGQEEAIAVFGHDPRIYQTTVKEYKKDKKGDLKSVVLVSLEAKKDEKTGRLNMVPIEGSEKEVPCQLVLIAAGFLGSEKYVTDAFKVSLDKRTNVEGVNGSHATSVKKVFTAGDMHTGQSLVVKAIAEGRKCAREVDEFLMGYSNL